MYNDIFRMARDFGKYGILDSKKKVWFFRILGIVFVVYLIIRLVSCVGAFALTTSTYADTLGTGTISNNLLSMIPEGKSYVIFQNDSNSYYCFYGSKSDFELSSQVISAQDISFVRYSRLGNNYNWVYSSGTDDLSLTINNVISSNLDTEFLTSQNYNYSSVSTQYLSFVALLVFFPIVMITNLRRLGHEYH